MAISLMPYHERRCHKNAYGDYFPPTHLTNENIWGHILFGIADAVVDTTIIQGRIIMRDKKILNIDEQEITAKSRELAQRVWSKH